MPLLPISHQQQRQPAECLAACAVMLLDYWQRPTDYDTLLKVLQIGYAGAPFRNLHYLEALGASVFIEQGQLETLRSLLARKLPPIIFVSTQDLSYWDEVTQHAVVVAGIDETHVYLHDPAFSDAPKTVTIDEFMLAWLEMDEFYALIQWT